MIPLSKNRKDIDRALYAGEEFELLFTLCVPEARRLLASKKNICSAIGQVLERKEGLKLIDRNFKERQLIARGFRHF